MINLPKCPKCSSEYTYEDNGILICPECAHEWNREIENDNAKNKILIDVPEKIYTPRLLLQMPGAGFGPQLHEALSEGYQDYVSWLNWSPNLPSAEQLEEESRKHQAEFILRDFIRYLIIDRTTGELLGRCGFPPLQTHWAIPQFGISYFIRKSKRSQGYATEAAHALTIIAFNILKAKKVEIYCDKENIASTKIPLKLGFALEYTQRGGWPRSDGQLAYLQTYSLFDKSTLPALNITW